MNQVQNVTDDPPGSRLFVVCGKSVESEVLEQAFAPYGNVQHVKVVRDKGVAYVKYDKASSAALAIEDLNGAVLNNGRGPKLKVLLADPPNARFLVKPVSEADFLSDPVNVPPRSRLFLVVPKQAEIQRIQDDLASYSDFEYCKIDLVASKGVVFCKFFKSSSALRALEEISQRGTIADYKIKCMLAEPKTKKVRADNKFSPSSQDYLAPFAQQPNKLEYGMTSVEGMSFKLPVAPGVHSDYPLGGLSGLTNFNSFGGVGLQGNLPDMQSISTQVGLGFGSGLNGLHSGSPVPTPAAPLSKQRLFVVVNKGVGEDAIARLFRRFAGMEYCDLKKDKFTGKSKGFCYVNYSTPEAAAAAVDTLNAVEFPPNSGQRIKVMFAEPLGFPNGGMGNVAVRSSLPNGVAGGGGVIPQVAVHSPQLVRNLGPSDVVTVQESLANIANIPRVSPHRLNI